VEYRLINVTSNELSDTRRRNEDVGEEHWRMASFRTLKGVPVMIESAKPEFDSDHLLPDITEPDSFFPVHLKCLTLIEYVVTHKLFSNSVKPISGLAAVEHFYRLLDRVRPNMQESYNGIAGQGVEWEHGYYGARRFWWDWWSIEWGFEFLYADPFNIPTLTEYLLSNLQRITSQGQSWKTPATHEQESLNEDSRPAIDCLPIEVLDEITSYLPVSSILSLHRTNRKLFNRTPFHQTFWRNQLLSGKLVYFLWDIDAALCIQKDNEPLGNTYYDWKTLALTLREEPFVELALKHRLTRTFENDNRCDNLDTYRRLSKDAASKLKGSPPLGLINRVRIMKTIEEAIRLAQDEIQHVSRPWRAGKPLPTPPSSYHWNYGYYSN
jgi:hypothetical protein